MEVLTCSTVQYAKKPCHSQEKSVIELMQDVEPNSEEQTKQISLSEKKVDHNTMQCDGQEQDGATTIDHDDDLQNKEACLDFQNSHVDVNTIDSEPLSESKEELSISASKWPEHDESLALWVKWRGKWQAGIKCERVDWPLATVKSKPTHDRKSYIVIFFPHKRYYSWADTLLVCAIDELPQPIAHRSHKVGVQLVEDLTVARRFIMKKLVIGVLNIVDQLPIQVLVETARDLVVWREFAEEASRCKSYPDLGRLLLKLQNMLLQKYLDANWLQHSFHLWVEKCNSALSADSIELLKEELMDSILWSEVNILRDSQGQPALGYEWKMWKNEVMKSFSMTHSLSSVGSIHQASKNGGIEPTNNVSPLVQTLQISRKRPKLEVRRAEPHVSSNENKISQENNFPEIDSAFFTGQCVATENNAIVPFKEVLPTSPCNVVDRIDGFVVETSNSVKHVKEKSRQCVAFIESKGRRCVRWANDGDEYCCVHLTSRFTTQSPKTDIISSVEACVCQGSTNKGSRCKHRSLPGSPFCKKHRLRGGDGILPPSSPASELKRKNESISKEIVVVGEPQRPMEENVSILMDVNVITGREIVVKMPEICGEESNGKNIEIDCCIGLGIEEGYGNCQESPKRHSLYCEKHIPSWLKRARNGKSRIITKDVFIDLLKTCSSRKEKLYLHEACDVFYKLFKNILSVRNQVPQETQFQWALNEASKDLNVAEFLTKLVSKEKERLITLWGFNPSKDSKISCSLSDEKALVPFEKAANDDNHDRHDDHDDDNDGDGSFKCKICFEEFSDDQTLGTHFIDRHNKEAQWLFRGYACAICLDSFTNKKVLETHVQERHHAQFVDHCMLIQCIPCGSHFGNPEELWSHVLSHHTEGFRQSRKGEFGQRLVNAELEHAPSKGASGDYNESNGKLICKFCGLKFDLLPDLGRHHQAAHMGPTLLSSRPKKKGLRFYTYRLKSGRLTRPGFKKGLGPTSYRLRNKGSIVLKKRLQPVNSNGLNLPSHVTNTPSLVRLTEAQCSAIAKILSSEAQKTRARPSNHEILSIARSVCCKVSLQKSLEQKYGELPERLYLKAAKLCSEQNIPVNWHQEGFNCSIGCKPQKDRDLGSVLSCPINELGNRNKVLLNSQVEECEMDESHFVINPRNFRWGELKTTIILCDDISFGKERVPIRCVVDKNLLDSIRYPMFGSDGQVIFLPWESFAYVTKPLLDKSLDVNIQNLQLGCGCSQSTCCPEKCDHVYLFNNDYEHAMDNDGKLMTGRFPYNNEGRLVLEDKYLVYECNNLCKCNSDCSNRVLQNGVRVKMEIFKTKNKGWAVRACETILRGSFVCEFIGEVLDEQEAQGRRKRKTDCDYLFNMGIHMQHMSEWMEGQVNYFIDATKYGNVSRFINHSCCPNLECHMVLVESMDFQLAHVGFFAKHEIAAGEELCIDYRYELEAGNGCPCLCGALTCKGRLH